MSTRREFLRASVAPPAYVFVSFGGKMSKNICRLELQPGGGDDQPSFAAGVGGVRPRPPPPVLSPGPRSPSQGRELYWQHSMLLKDFNLFRRPPLPAAIPTPSRNESVRSPTRGSEKRDVPPAFSVRTKKKLVEAEQQPVESFTDIMGRSTSQTLGGTFSIGWKSIVISS